MKNYLLKSMLFTLILCIGLSGTYMITRARIGSDNLTAESGDQLTSDKRNALLAKASTNSLPIGSIIAWHKSMTNTPALPDGFVECNGQTVTDSSSVYNGIAVPNLNNEKRFLRGNNVSGLLQDATSHLYVQAGSNGAIYYGSTSGLSASNYDQIYNGTTTNYATKAGSAVSLNYTYYTSRPINMSVVYIIKIK